MSSITLTDNLVKQIRVLQSKEGKADLKLRILVDGGGCQGFEYKFSLVTDVNPDDEVFEKDGISVVIDEISLPYMKGAEITYTDDLIGAHFAIKNPNAVSTCGCGTSFSTAN